VLVSFVFFIGPIIYIFGVAGASDHETISIGQAVIRLAIALLILGLDALLVTYLGWKEGQA
jgi:hypothetical protein